MILVTFIRNHVRFCTKAWSLLAVLIFLSCGRGTLTTQDLSKQTGLVESETGLVTLKLKFFSTWTFSQNMASNGLNLASNPGSLTLDSYILNLANCVSGMSGTSSSATFSVLNHDSNCVVKLTSFVLHGKTYTTTGTGSSPFTTWLVGDKAVFRNSDTDLITVKVVSQLSSPIQSTDYVSYNFENLTQSVSPSIAISDPHTLSLGGQDAPNFKIVSGDATFTGIISSGPSAGYALLNFKLTCTNGPMIVGGYPPSTTFCPTLSGATYSSGIGVDIYGANNSDSTSLFSYKLILDSSGVGTLSFAQAQAAFAAGGDSTVSTSDLVGSTAFNTVTLTGPGPVDQAANIHMFLILQAKNTNSNYTNNIYYSSFQYFAITLPAVNP